MNKPKKVRSRHRQGKIKLAFQEGDVILVDGMPVFIVKVLSKQGKQHIKATHFVRTLDQRNVAREYAIRNNGVSPHDFECVAEDLLPEPGTRREDL